MKQIDAINRKKCLPVNTAVCFGDLVNAAQALNVLMCVNFFSFVRVTKNLPFRSHTMSPEECFQTFIKAIFYVGKGKRSRPYSHLYEALEYHRGDKTSKVSRVALISTVSQVEKSNNPWIFLVCVAEIVPQSGAHPSGVELGPRCHLSALLPECHSSGGVHQRGVHGGRYRSENPHLGLYMWASPFGWFLLCMFLFSSILKILFILPGLRMLTNQKKGDFYGVVSNWLLKRKRELGIHLLYRAMHIFLAEGERQLRPLDIRQ